MSCVQIENEYGPQGKNLGAAGHNYMTWAAKLAVGLDTGVPWVMCKEEDAPDPVVSTSLNFTTRSCSCQVAICSFGQVLT